MFDVGFSELLLLAIVALVVLGPEKLPHAARVAGAWVGRIRRTLGTMQDEILREVEAQEVRTRLEKQLREIGGNDFMAEVRAESRAIGDDLEMARATLDEAAAPATAAPAPLTPPATQELPGPLLPEAATPPDQVRLDGEAAYREWLAAQRRQGRAAPVAATSADSVAPAATAEPAAPTGKDFPA